MVGDNGAVRVLIAPDHFGGPLTAVQAAAVIAAPWQRAGHEPVPVPMSDGGSGLMEAVHQLRGGTLSALDLSGPHGPPVPAAVLHVPGGGGGTAYIEPGAVLGAPGPDGSPGSAGAPGSTSGGPGPGTDAADQGAAVEASRGTSAGVADLLHAALQTGAGRVVIGLGATPTHDGGRGLIVRLAELIGLPQPPHGEPWQVLGPLRGALAGVDLVVAAAQDAPLLGLHGAGAGLQRMGVSAIDAQQIERQVADFAHAALAHVRSLPRARTLLGGSEPEPGPGASHTGAGGGVAFAVGLLGGRALPGAAVVAEELALRQVLEGIDLVITGTASLDNAATYDGVVPTIGSLAAEHGLPVVALAHEVFVNRTELATAGISAAYPLIDRPLVPGRSSLPPGPEDPAEALSARAERVVRNWSPR